MCKAANQESSKGKGNKVSLEADQSAMRAKVQTRPH